MEKTSKTKAVKEKPVLSPYLNWVHRFGRIGLIVLVLYMIAIPIILCTVYNAFPPLDSFIKGGIGVWAMFVPLTISECISYSPLLGSSSYLAFLTGNVLNLKLPAALNAAKLTNTEVTTEEGDAIAMVAVASSSILTIIVIAIGVVLLVPLRPVLDLPQVKTATAYMLPALFGSLFIGLLGKDSGKHIIRGKLLIPIIPTLIIFALTVFGVIRSGFEGIAILVMLPITMLCAWILYRKGLVKVEAKSASKEEA